MDTTTPTTQQGTSQIKWNTSADFAKAIKTKYPAYNNIDDNTLTQKFLAKYPVYGSQIGDIARSQQHQQDVTMEGLGRNNETPKQNQGLFASEVNFGHSLSDASHARNAASTVGKNYEENAFYINKLSQAIKKAKSEGKDTSHSEEILHMMLQESGGGAVAGTDLAKIIPSVNKSTEQILGEATGVLGDAFVGSGNLNALLGGATLGATHGMQNNESAGGVVGSALKGALTGKILEYGFRAASPYIQRAVEKYGSPILDEISNYIPEAAKDAYATLAEKADASLSKVGGNTGSEFLDKANKFVNKPFSAIEDKTKSAFGSSETKDFDKSIKMAQEKMNPTGKYTSAERSDILGDQTKKKGIGMFKRDVITPKVTGEHEEVADMIRQGKLKSGSTPGEDVQAIKAEAKAHDMSIDEYLNSGNRKNILVNRQDTEKVFQGIKDEAKRNRIFISDSAEQKAYNDVIDVAREELKNNKGTVGGVRTSVKSFNKRMEEILGKDIYSQGGEATTVGKARLQAAKDIRAGLNNHIQDTLNDVHTTRVSEMTPSIRDIFKEAQSGKYETFDEFESAMKDKTSAASAEQKFAGKTGTPNMETESNVMSKSGLNMNERSTLKGGTHGKGYSTTPEQDLHEIWDMAHEQTKGSAGDVFKNSLTKEARLLSASDEIKYRAGDTIGKSKVVRFLTSSKGRAFQRSLGLIGLGVTGTKAGEWVIKEIGGGN